MRAKTILMLLFVLSLGTAAALVLRAIPHNVTASAEAVPQDTILVATAPLAAGTLLRAEDVAWHPISTPAKPDEFVRPSAVTLKIKPEADEEARAAVYGAALRSKVASGGPILKDGIVAPGDREFLNVVLTPGTRAISIPVATSGAGTGLLHPGDRVDVILTQTFKDDKTPITRRSVGETVVQDLRVLAIDPPDAKQGAGMGRAVTLEVSPDQAEKINVSIELGKLSLILRGSGVDASSANKTDTDAQIDPVKPTWAGDVSPALRAAAAPQPPAPTERPLIRVMRGNQTEELQSH
jgi:pilus assembly protein CpaB